MKPEIEASFINIDKSKIRNQLGSLGAKLVQPEILMQRVVFSTGPKSFARVRDEGNRIVMTYKRVDDLSLSGTKEINLEVNDYATAINFLKSVGLKPKADQETLREEWLLDNVEICIDTWPWIATFIELEGPSENAVKNVASRLNLDMGHAHYGSVDEIYKLYYNVTNDDVNFAPEIKFTNELPNWLEGKRRPDIPEV